MQRNYHYPATSRSRRVEDFHGIPVPDPYDWLEDPDSAETAAWVAAQNALSSAYIHAEPARQRIEARLTELWDFPKVTVPNKKGRRYFYSRNDGLQNQFVRFYRNSLDGDAFELLDPNRLSDDGTVALTGEFPSQNGSFLAYGVSSSGSDWQEIRIRNVETGQDLPDLLRWCKFTGIAWKHDESGFFYSRFPDPGTVPADRQSFDNKVYWHRLDTSQAEDELIYERPDAPELAFTPIMSDDGRYLVLHVWHGTDTENRIYYRNVEKDGPFVRLLDEADARYEFIDNVGSTFYFNTDHDAPRGRIIAIDVENPDRALWQEIIPQGDDPIAFATMAGDHLAVAMMHDAHHQLKLWDLQGNPAGEIALPAFGAISGLSGKREDREMFVAFESFLYPQSIFRYDFDSGRLTTFFAPELNFDLSRFETRQIFYTSKDGTRVPMFLVHRRDLVLDGNNPTLLSGYGGFNIAMTPSFWISQLVWLEAGGVFVLANLRGGSEYGEEWHRAGMLANKQNVFDDFISAGRWLVDSGITSPGKLAIMGGSNGGLLVAACMLQDPRLFGAVICRVPVADMLHYHRWTVGRYWTGEYGNAEADPDHFRFLYAYSPLHNVSDGETYPPTLIMTADTDDRVVPAHAKKFASRLQAADSGQNPILVRIETKAGHGLGKPTSKVIEEQTDIFAFLFRIFAMSL